ncbi:GGDEF domain-containing protein [Bosea sp. F3-2]|uniref:GGDEF domain-containing protein n=1 Tax=Bosea sp. F3-2 TaxID=2599640 RepID=UPI0011EF31A7|nr:GGDEF domain-containing protein [Bosea sp. F3-2]QEL24124.1 GGDEF domain-containing protein [Bosea sp. F3-2]
MTTSPQEPAKGYARHGAGGLKAWGSALAGSIAAIVVSSGLAMGMGTALPAWVPLGLGAAAAVALAGTARTIGQLLRQIETASRMLGEGDRDGDLLDDARKAREEIGKYRLEVERLQDVDPVTGLGNRRWLQIRAMQEFSRAQREGSALSLILLKIEGYNELATRDDGNTAEALELHVADTLKSFVRPYDVVARVSPSEFGVLLLGAPAPTATSIAHRLRNAVLARPPLLLGQSMPDIPVVAVERKADETNFDELLTRARSAEVSDHQNT